MADFELGYALSSEEHPPNRLVANACRKREIIPKL
jgi:hypothetical protein